MHNVFCCCFVPAPSLTNPTLHWSPGFPAAVEGTLARQRHRHQGAENPRLDDPEKQRFQRGVPKAQVRGRWDTGKLPEVCKCLCSRLPTDPSSPHPFLAPQDFLAPKCVASAGRLPITTCTPSHHHHPLDALRLPLQCAPRRHQ